MKQRRFWLEQAQCSLLPIKTQKGAKSYGSTLVLEVWVRLERFLFGSLRTLDL
jgi:hypothetical protein